MSMSIRSGVYSDIDIITDIHTLCWREVYSFMPYEVHSARNWKYRHKQWECWFSSPPRDETLLVLTYDDVVVGFSLAKPNTDPDIDALGEMHAGYVLPDYRGGMSGPAMMRLLAEKMNYLGQWPSCIWAFKQNPYRRFYSALGWRAVIQRDRVIAGKKIPEIGYISPSYSSLIGRLDRMLAATVQRQILRSSPLISHRNHRVS